MWTEKETSDGVVNIKGIPGDPREWIRSGIRQYSMSYFTDEYSRNTSHRVALGFRYAYSDLSFSDRGFKNIYRIELRVSITCTLADYLALSSPRRTDRQLGGTVLGVCVCYDNRLLLASTTT